MATLRVVLDTNVLVSGLAYPGGIPGRIAAACWQGSLALVLSNYILDEFVRVLTKLSRAKFTPSEIEDLAASLLFRAEIVDPGSHRDESLRDENDQQVLGTLLAAHADYLITGDRDLLALAETYPILTPAAFWERHGG
jgi:putative PIN family toxin of toxin-antitoxin system